MKTGTWVDNVDKGFLVWRGSTGEKPRNCLGCSKKTTGTVKDVRGTGGGGGAWPFCQDCARKKGLT